MKDVSVNASAALCSRSKSVSCVLYGGIAEIEHVSATRAVSRRLKGAYFRLASPIRCTILLAKGCASSPTEFWYATLLVRHVPPEKPEIKIPVEWMRHPVADTPNNWVEVGKRPNGKYLAEVGKETFDVRIKVSLANGKILSAKIDNPVEAISRECADATLASCTASVSHQILRQIEIY